MSNKKGLLALSPLLVFIALYLITSIIAHDFYKVPITVAFMISSIYAVATSWNFPLPKRIDMFSKGAGTSNMMMMLWIFVLAGAFANSAKVMGSVDANMMMMLWIFVLAGAFANSAKVMGSVDATVNLTLMVLPGSMIMAGLFLAACFISLSIGTSVGTIVALVPIAAGLAGSTGVSIPMMTAVVVGGAFFGDNLSFISDTTIVATSTQGCRMSDKFRVNFFIVMPAALVIFIIYIFAGSGIQSPTDIPVVEFTKVIPYLVVLVCAIFGMNVMAVLTIGIILTGLIGMINGTYDIYGWFSSMGEGILGMSELIIVTMLAGGLLEIVKANGGIDFIISRLSAHIKSKRGAELSIAGLVALTDICTANNTVAIITVGGIAKQIGDKFGVDNRKCASILDTFSCCMQGLIPYGAQMLMAAGLAQLNPIQIIPYLYYPLATGIVALLAILFRYPKRYS